MSETATEYFERMLGFVPPPIAALADGSPAFLEAYIAARSSILDDAPGGLDLATKELILILLDVVYDNELGALNHLDAALRLGLKPQAILETMLLAALVGGIHTWSKAGCGVYKAAVERAHTPGGADELEA